MTLLERMDEYRAQYENSFDFPVREEFHLNPTWTNLPEVTPEEESPMPHYKAPATIPRYTEREGRTHLGHSRKIIVQQSRLVCLEWGHCGMALAFPIGVDILISGKALVYNHYDRHLLPLPRRHPLLWWLGLADYVAPPAAVT